MLGGFHGDQLFPYLMKLSLLSPCNDVAKSTKLLIWLYDLMLMKI